MKNYIEPTLQRKTDVSSMLKGSAIFLACGFLFLNIIGIYLIGPYAWDDGAITLAYARTLGEHGIFALTKVSEVVEGTSSLLLAFTIALLHRTLTFSFGGLILSSQLLALLFLLLTLFLVFNQLQKIFPSPFSRLYLVSLVGALPMFTAEVLNGMEMTLMGFLLTAFLISFQNRTNWIFVLIPALLLVRFEAIFYLLFSFGLYLAFNRTNMRFVRRLVFYTIAVFLFVSLFRWIYFHDIFPNTVWAKMNPPYSFKGTLAQQIYNKLQGVGELMSVETYLLLAAFASLVLRDRHASRSDLGIFLIISYAAFAAVTGSNWGYLGRMFLASLPLTILVIVNSVSSGRFQENSLKIDWGGFKLTFAGRSVIFAVLLVALLGTHMANYRLFSTNIKAVLDGGHYQGLLPRRLDEMASHRLQHVKHEFANWYGVTPWNFRVTGLAIENMRILLGLKEIKFMVPDVGGLALCCENIIIVDSGLLTNSFLAKKGYGVFDSYLKEVKPDVIETHEPWSQASGIYNSMYFQNNYAPIVFDNNLFWIRNDHKAAITTSPLISKKKIIKVTDLGDVRYVGYDFDQNYLRSKDFGDLWRISSTALPGPVL